MYAGKSGEQKLKRTIIMNMLSMERRLAVLEESRVAEFHFDDPKSEDLEGNIYIGRVVKVLPGMQAAFVDIGLEKNGFIHRDHLISFYTSELNHDEKKQKSISQFVREGEALLVQVVKNSVGTKGPKLTNVIELSGRLTIFLPNGKYISLSKKISDEQVKNEIRRQMKQFLRNNEGVIVRTAAQHSSIEETMEEVKHLREEYIELLTLPKKQNPPLLLKKGRDFSDKVINELNPHTISEIIVDDSTTLQRIKSLFPTINAQFYQKRENIFLHYGIQQELQKLMQKVIRLNSGAYLIIDYTEALTVVDVNTGKYTGKTHLKDTVLKTNELAAREIARQIRLRDIGGIVLVDFIDMKSETDRNQVLNILKQELAKDRTHTVVYGFTQLGILELTRKRVRKNVIQQNTQPCDTCNGLGVVNSNKTVVYELEREIMELKGQDVEAIWIQASQDVLQEIQVDHKQLITDLEELLHIKIFMTEISSSKPFYEIRHLGTAEEVRERIKRN